MGNFLGNYRRRMTGVAIVSRRIKVQVEAGNGQWRSLVNEIRSIFNPKVPGSSPGRPTR